MTYETYDGDYEMPEMSYMATAGAAYVGDVPRPRVRCVGIFD